MQPLLTAARMLRPLNLLLGSLAVVITATLMPHWPPGGRILLAVTVVICLNAAANALNDWFDFATDQVNRPGRPLVSGVLPRWIGLALAAVLFALGAGLALTLPATARNIAVGLALPLLILYTPVFKGLPLAGNLVVAGIMGLTFLFAAAAFGDVSAGWVPAGLAFGFNVLREAVKDVQDVAGDGAEGIGTLPVRFGVPVAMNFIYVFTLLLMAGCLVPYISEVYGIVYLTVLVIGVELPLAYLLYYLLQNPHPTGCTWAAKLLKVDIFAGLLAVYLSRFDV